jgi:hypothetical protein
MLKQLVNFLFAINLFTGCLFEFSVAMFEVPSDESKGGIGFITDFIDIC